ncbi:MAG: DUF2141 domain-containing protein [Bacteroidota bacterium]|nr:DUF2141 domain-containing protein [Bacteroidota bacterium]
MIKVLVRFLLAIFLASPFTSFTPPIDQNLKVTIIRLHSNDGVVLVSLFKDGKGYPDDATKAFGKQKAYIVEKSATIIFKSVPPGSYAIAILHDENNNQKMDKNMLGIPKEGYGFSNNASGTFGPPSYKKASFIHGAEAQTSIQIKTKYF